MSTSPLGRVVEIAENGRHLAREDGFLVISANQQELGRVALDDLLSVIATAPGTTASCAALAELSTRGIPFVICGRNFVPTSIVWPLAGHHAQQRRMECQINASLPLKKRLWAMLVAAKIRHQGSVLSAHGHNAEAFTALARSVRSGDPENIEAQAARRYWPALLGADFRRDQDAGGTNAMLNYGYTVLRAGVARAIVAAGLHPGLGIFHRHPHNPMPLADDLMEPFRPFVDELVLQLLGDKPPAMNPAAKRQLVTVLNLDLPTRSGMSPLSTCLNRLAASLGESFVGGVADLDLPLPFTALAEEADDGADS
jgi:CRISPR-associated protein Cas1